MKNEKEKINFLICKCGYAHHEFESTPGDLEHFKNVGCESCDSKDFEESKEGEELVDIECPHCGKKYLTEKSNADHAESVDCFCGYEVKTKERIDILALITEQLERAYHNATLTDRHIAESDYEADLIQSQLEYLNRDEIDDLNSPDSSEPHLQFLRQHYGKVYQWGRGGRTVLHEGFINNRNFNFNIKTIDSLELWTEDMTFLGKLYVALSAFNTRVEEYCKNVVPTIVEFLKEEYQDELEENKGKIRRVRTIIIYE